MRIDYITPSVCIKILVLLLYHVLASLVGELAHLVVEWENGRPRVVEVVGGECHVPACACAEATASWGTSCGGGVVGGGVVVQGEGVG